MHIALNVKVSTFSSDVYRHNDADVGSVFGTIDGASIQLVGTPGDLKYLAECISTLADKLQVKMEDDKKIPRPTV